MENSTPGVEDVLQLQKFVFSSLNLLNVKLSVIYVFVLLLLVRLLKNTLVLLVLRLLSLRFRFDLSLLIKSSKPC